MNRYNIKKGKWGEDKAEAFLKKKGYSIIERNYRCRWGEIDIIAERDGTIHFVEVKTRRMSVQAPPQENVGRTKQARIAKAAGQYLKSAKGLPYGNLECMFDVVAITFKGGKAHTEWIPQAYIPIYI